MQNLDEFIASPVEIEEQLLKLFNKSDELVIFDIGACECEDSIRYLKLFPNAKIHAFEPRPDNVITARRNLAAFDARSIELAEIALSDDVGTAIFHLSSGGEDSTGSNFNRYNKSSSLFKPELEETQKYWPTLSFDETIEVQTDKLENYCMEKSINSIDFIHMDVQGAEIMVLRGAGRLVNQIKSVWLELGDVPLYQGQPLRNEVDTFMKDHGFIKILESEALADVYGDALYVNKDFFPEAQQVQVNDKEPLPGLFAKLAGLVKKRG